jgi:hypothetical protein
MSHQEFENYLALLTKLLRISPRQRDRVAAEFRAHMEDRLDELLARGLPRDEAIRTALEEFGDAAGLAAEFASISRNQRRRWLMSITTASVAAVLLLAAGIITFWPGGNAGPGVAQTIAQQADPFAPPRGASGGGGQPAQPVETKPAETTLTDKLNQRFDAEFIETPLKDVVDFLQDKTNISFWINSKKLEEAGVSIDTPISLQFNQVRLSTFLDIMLDQHNLVYVEKDDILVLTSREDADAATEVRVYDCRDLLTMPTVGQANPYGMPGMGGSGYSGADGYGGGYPGSSGGYGSGSDSGYGGSGYGPGGYREGSYGGDGAAAGPAAAGPGAGASGYGPPASAGGQDPASAPAGTPSSGAPAAPRRSKRSDVLPQVVGSGGGMMPGGMGGMGGGMGGGFGGEPQQPRRPLTAEELKAEQLMDIVTTAVDPDSWQEMGGIGTIGEYNGLIVVRQTARTHTKVEKVLDMLREAANLPKTKGPRVVR